MQNSAFRRRLSLETARALALRLVCIIQCIQRTGLIQFAWTKRHRSRLPPRWPACQSDRASTPLTIVGRYSKRTQSVPQPIKVQRLDLHLVDHSAMATDDLSFFMSDPIDAHGSYEPSLEPEPQVDVAEVDAATILSMYGMPLDLYHPPPHGPFDPVGAEGLSYQPYLFSLSLRPRLYSSEPRGNVEHPHLSCFVPLQHRTVRMHTTTFVHTSVIKSDVTVDFCHCRCEEKEHDEEHTKAHAAYLADRGLFTTNVDEPRYVFCFSVLEELRVHFGVTLEGAKAYMDVLRRRTKPHAPEDVPDLHEELLEAYKAWDAAGYSASGGNPYYLLQSRSPVFSYTPAQPPSL